MAGSATDLALELDVIAFVCLRGFRRKGCGRGRRRGAGQQIPSARLDFHLIALGNARCTERRVCRPGMPARRV